MSPSAEKGFDINAHPPACTHACTHTDTHTHTHSPDPVGRVRGDRGISEMCTDVRRQENPVPRLPGRQNEAKFSPNRSREKLWVHL